MVDLTLPLPGLSPVAGKQIVARFDGGRLSSDGGLLVLHEIERRLEVADRLAACIDDPRDPGSTVHPVADIIRFRMLMIAAGYEDGNDATGLRIDPLFKLALERVPSGRDLCSQSTISRLENLPDVRTLLRLGRALVDVYCGSFRQVPRRIVLDIADQFALLIDREAADRANIALATRLKRAQLRQAACFENLDLKATRGLDKGLIRDLFTCRWITDHRHLIVTGATGTGKTWICCALGNQAARESFSVLYARLSRLLDDLATARLANAVGRLMRRLAKVDLLILDDWAMTDLTAQQRRDLMEIVDDRHDRRSIILATQVPVDRWHDMIGDPTYADAILDRIVHNATRVELKGESLRKTRTDAAMIAAAN